MKKSLAVGLSFGLALFAISAFAATPPKTGAICTKVGLTQNYNGMKYTCIKSGKKLVWDKGVLITQPSPKASPSPTQSSNPTPTPQPSSSVDVDFDGYPKNVPAPDRSCPSEGGKATLYGGSLTCVKGKWVLDPGSTISFTPSPKPTTSATASTPLPSIFVTPTPSVLRPNSFTGLTSPLNPSIPDLNPSNAKLDFDSEVSLRARQEFLTRLSLKSTDTPNIEWVIDPSADPKKTEKYLKEVSYAVQFYSFIRNPNIPLRVYLGSSANFQWIYDNLMNDLAPDGLEGNWLDAKLARSKVDEGFSGGAGGLRTKDGKSVLFFNYGKYDSDYDALQNQIFFHEYTHVIQKTYLSGSMAPMLCWMREGYANYMGYNLTTRYSTAAFLNSWYQEFQYADTTPELDGWRTKTAADWAKWFTDNEKKTAFDCDSYDNYAIGSLAWEYLHGTYGYAAVDRFYRALSQAYVGVCEKVTDANNILCPGWKKLYLQTFGNTPESDYQKFGEHIYRKLAWIRNQNNLAGDKAKVLAPTAWSVQSKY